LWLEFNQLLANMARLVLILHSESPMHTVLSKSFHQQGLLLSLGTRAFGTYFHLPLEMQKEVFACLSALECKDITKKKDLDMVFVKQQYFSLAQKYHPDMRIEKSAEKFIVVQKAYDRLLELDSQSEGRLFKLADGLKRKRVYTEKEK
jgi:hypothetical protein